jgi:hypothetical protein
MLYKIEKDQLSKVDAKTVKDISGDKKEGPEKYLESLLSENIQYVIRTNELLVISRSRKWQEEADILALDSEGNLYIFELKAWESRSDNLLQVMRYAQIFFDYGYDKLNSLWHAYSPQSENLSSSHKNYFGLDKELKEESFNQQQKLIVMTNGLDFNTRKAIQYWYSKGVKIFPWVYRVYEIEGKPYLSFEAFGAKDDPYEDTPIKYHLVNTCMKAGVKNHNHMIQNKRASAFYEGWKETIKNIRKSDWVFLYQSGVGIVAFGKAKDNYKSADWEGNIGEEYYVDLEGFKEVTPAVSYANLKELCGYKVPVLSTYTSLRNDAAENLLKHLKEENNSASSAPLRLNNND